MRRKTNRKKVDTLYVLGAGASYALSNVNRKTKNHVKQVTPLDRNFLRSLEEKFDAPLILKLHGSTNWRCVRKHFDSLISGDIAADEKITIWHSDKTSKPDDGDSPLIIPPIPNKPITRSSIFNFLWGRAYEYMHEAKRIVIVGYSCPPTDTLARTMFGHFTSNSLQEIFVVDPDATALKSYRDMLEPKLAAKIKWRYYSDFAEYIHGELK